MTARPFVRPVRIPAALAVVAAGLVGIAPQAAAAGPTCLGAPATVVGAGNIVGTPGDDVMVGSSGDDVIIAGDGDDLVCAGDGNDVVRDGLGQDEVSLEGGDDMAIASGRWDSNDVFDGGAGTDTADYSLRTTPVRLSLNAAPDDGAVAEHDRLSAMENAIGGLGNDTISGSDGDNVLDGGVGDDTISDLAGADTVHGGEGNDKFSQGITEDVGDVLDGGDGFDLVSYAVRSAPLRINLDGVNESGEAGEGDLLRGIERAQGGSGSDQIYGTDGPNELYGGGGNDAIYDGSGADTVVGGSGCDYMVQPGQVDFTDVIKGGAGSCDYVSYGARAEGVQVRLNTTAAVNGAPREGDVVTGTEQAAGGSGDDVLIGNGGVNSLYAGAGSDVLRGLGGNDTLLASDGVGGNDDVDGGYGYEDFASIDAGDTAQSIESLEVH